LSPWAQLVPFRKISTSQGTRFPTLLRLAVAFPHSLLPAPFPTRQSSFAPRLGRFAPTAHETGARCAVGRNPRNLRPTTAQLRTLARPPGNRKSAPLDPRPDLQRRPVLSGDPTRSPEPGPLPQRRHHPPPTRRLPRNRQPPPRLRRSTPKALTLPRHHEKLIGRANGPEMLEFRGRTAYDR